MALKSIYLVVWNLIAWAHRSREDAAAGDVETLMMCHQLLIAQRRTPPRELQRKPSRADRAWMALLAQLLPHDHLARLRLLVTPGPLTHWHRDLLHRR